MAIDPKREMLNHHAAVGVSASALGLVILYTLLAMTQSWIGHPARTTALTATMVIVALWGGSVWLWLRSHPATPKNAHPILFSFSVALALHHAIHLWVLGEPSHTINPALAAIAFAFFMTSRSWFFAALVTCVCGWLPKAVTEGPFSPEWGYWTAILGASLVLAIVAFEARRMTLVRIDSMRQLAEQSKRDAESALAKAESAIAERMTMEQVMHEAQRREALGTLAGGIAHDFNNLLAIITGNVELARLSLEVGPESASRLDLIDEAASRGALLTRQMLVYAGKAPARSTDIDLGSRVSSTAALFQSTLGSNTMLRLQESPTRVFVKADGALLDQVIVNLVQNAVDACEVGGGQIVIRWGYEDPLPGETTEFAFLEVADTGCGMNDATLLHAFDPFFTTKKQGTGLGLSVVKGIAESHGADIKLTSSGSGTTVRFVMPTGDVQRIEPPTEITPRTPPSLPLPVLVVDDDPGVLQIAQSFLEADGYSVIAATDGAEALRMIADGAGIAAALIDLTMPEMSGYDLAKMLRHERPDLPIMIMSGFDRDNTLNRIPAGDELGFLPKPFSRAQLTNALLEATEQSQN